MTALEKHRQLFNQFVVIHNNYLDSVLQHLALNDDQGADLSHWHAVARQHRTNPAVLDARLALRKAVAGLGANVFWQNRRALWDQFFRLHLTSSRDLIKLTSRPPAKTARVGGSFTFKFPKPVAGASLLVETLPELPKRAEHVLIAVTPGDRHAVVRIPVDQVELNRGQYVYCDFPFIMHRPLPPGCMVHEVTISGRQHGALWRQQVSFLLTLPTPPLQDVKAPLTAIDVGWRMTNDGLLVATTLNGDELSRLVLPLSIVADFAFLEDADAELNRCAQTAAGPEFATKPWQSILRSAHQSKAITQWASSSKALRHEASNLRARLKRERLSIYRRYANAVCAISSAVATEKLSLRGLSLGVQVPMHRSQQSMAAVSELLRCLHEACERTGRRFIQIPAHNTTRQHLSCGHQNKSTSAAVIHCEGCGQPYDPDDNAARQIASRAAVCLNLQHTSVVPGSKASSTFTSDLSTVSVDDSMQV